NAWRSAMIFRSPARSRRVAWSSVTGQVMFASAALRAEVVTTNPSGWAMPSHSVCKRSFASITSGGSRPQIHKPHPLEPVVLHIVLLADPLRLCQNLPLELCEPPLDMPRIGLVLLFLVPLLVRPRQRELPARAELLVDGRLLHAEDPLHLLG